MNRVKRFLRQGVTEFAAGIHLNVGTSNNRPRSIISRRDSGKGETPNSIPRAKVELSHGALGRLQFSSQMPIHGKSAGDHT